MIRVEHGDCRDVVKTLADCSIDSVVTDPPYSLVSIQKRFGKPGSAPAKDGRGASGPYVRASAGFMGKQWDTGEVAFDPAFWAEVYRVMKPGAYLLSFGGSRTWHRMASAIEDAGFEIRDTICWMFGSGFPKSLDVSKAIDKAAGAEREIIGPDEYRRARANIGTTSPIQPSYDKPRAAQAEANITAPATDAAKQWSGWGTALKPAAEFICMARKPLSESTVAANVLRWGTGAINVDACRIGTEERFNPPAANKPGGNSLNMSAVGMPTDAEGRTALGRWPANVIHDGSEEVEAAFARFGNRPSTGVGNESDARSNGMFGQRQQGPLYDGNGSASRFFFSAKADADDRLSSKHPTVKPVDLIAYLCRLVTRPGGLILDPFAGSGTLGMACMREGFDCILIEREREYYEDILRRVEHVQGLDTPLFAGGGE